MAEFFVRTTGQLPMMLRAFRKQSGLTQAEVAYRLNVTQQMLSKIERNATAVNAARLLQLLSILDVELVLRDRESTVSSQNGLELCGNLATPRAFARKKREIPGEMANQWH